MITKFSIFWVVKSFNTSMDCLEEDTVAFEKQWLGIYIIRDGCLIA